MFSIVGSQVAIRAEDFLILLLSFFLAVVLPKYWPQIKKDLVIKSILIYWLVGLLTIISGVWVTQTTSLPLSFLHWARRVEYMIPFIAAAVLATKKENIRFFTQLLLPIALAVWGYALAQIYLQAPVISTQNEEFSKGVALTLQPGVNISSTFAGHYDLAGYLVATLTIILGLTLVHKRQNWKFITLIALLPLFWLLLQTGSRIAFGASLLAIPAVLVLNRRPLWIIPIILIALIGAANTPQLIGRFGNVVRIIQFQTIQEKIKGVWDSRGEIFVPILAAETVPGLPPTVTPTPTATPTETLRPLQQDRSTSIRLDVEWPRALRALTKNPFLGTGYASISLATDNDYLRALGETGLLGFIAWGSIILAIGASLIRLLRSQTGLQFGYASGVCGMVISFLIIAAFIDVFEASKNATLFWMYTGLANGILWQKK